MKKVLYIVAMVLALTWIVSFFVLHAGMFIHAVLVIAILFYLQGVICAPVLRTRQMDMANGTS